jgi:hypothetical protein
MELLKQFKQKESTYENMPDKYIYGLENLDKLNTKAEKANFNRQLVMKDLINGICKDRNCDPEELWSMRFPITFSLIHNDTEVRVIFSWGKDNAQLDMSFGDYADLPKISSLQNLANPSYD